MTIPKKELTEKDSISFLGFILRIILILTIIGSLFWLLAKIAQAAENYNLKIEQHER